MLKCPKCNTIHKDGKKFCNVCGTSLEAKSILVCPSCGAKIKNKDAAFCMECGIKFEGDNKPVEKQVDCHIRMCSKCGHTLENNDARFCKSCGSKFDEENQPIVVGDNDKFYRLCTYCGLSYTFDENVKVCKKCGHELDLRPRREPKLTDEEQKIADENNAKMQELEDRKRKFEEERQEAERRKRKEERQRQEAEEQKRLEKQEQIKAEKRRKIKKFFKILGIIIAIFIIISLISLGVWKLLEKGFIEKGDAALAAGDYNTAITYYGYVVPFGETHSTYENKITTVAKAGAVYEEAKNNFDNYSYLASMDKAQEALGICSELTVAGDLYTQAQDKLGDYLQGQYDSGNYAQVYTTIIGMKTDYRSEKINGILASVDGIINSYIDNGNAFFKAGKYTEAVNAANQALAIQSDCQEATQIKNNVCNVYVNQGRQQFEAYNMDGALQSANQALSVASENLSAKQLKSDVTDYNTYTGYMEKSVEYYNNANYSSAQEYYLKVKNDTPGYMVKGQYESYITRLTEDAQYTSNPVVIDRDSWDCSSYRGRYYWNDDYAYFYFTMENRLNRSVEVTVEITWNDDEYYYTYIIGAKQTVRESAYLSGIDVYSHNEYMIYVDDTRILPIS